MFSEEWMKESKPLAFQYVLIEQVRLYARSLRRGAGRGRARSADEALAPARRAGRSPPWAEGGPRGDREAVLAALQQDGLALQWATRQLREDREVVLAAVRQNGHALAWAAGALRGDREVALAAVRQAGGALQWVMGGAFTDVEVSFAALRQDLGSAMPFVDNNEVYRGLVQGQHLWSDEPEGREQLLGLLRRCGNCLALASRSQRADRELALVAVQQNGLALQTVAMELQADREVALAAVRQNGCALGFASEPLRGDRGLALEAVRQAGHLGHCLAEELCADREIVLEAARHTAATMRRRGNEFVNAAIPGYLDYLTEAQRAVMPLEQRQAVIQYAIERVISDAEAPLSWASRELFEDRDFVLEAVRLMGTVLRYASDALKADREVVLAALQRDGPALKHASAELRADPELQLEARRTKSWSRFHVVDLEQEIAMDNPLAVAGTLGVICQVTELRPTPGGTVRFEAVLGLAGHEVKGELPKDSKIGILGRALRKEVLDEPALKHRYCRSDGRVYLHLILPGKQTSVSPLKTRDPLPLTTA